MIKILLNPKKFEDYDEEKGESKLANQTLFIVGPSSVTVEKTMVPYNSGKWGKRNQRVLAKHNCRGGTLPLWATVEGMWFEDTEFELVASSNAYPDLVMGVSAERIIVEKDGKPMTVEELWKLAKGGGSGSSGGNIPNTNVITY